MMRTVSCMACLAIALLIESSAFGGFSFNVQSATFISDGVNATTGSVNVFVLSDNPAVDFAAPPLIGSYQAAMNATSLTGSIASVSFQNASIATAPNTALFVNVPFTENTGVGPQRVRTAVADFGANPALFQGAGLYRLNFTVPTAQTGTFNLSFVNSGANITELTNSIGNVIPTGFNSGVITITAVPEPSSMCLGGLALLGMGLGKRWRNRKSQRSEVLGA